MFQKSLNEVDRIFPSNWYPESINNKFQDKLETFFTIFKEDLKPLIDICFQNPFKIFEYSKSEYLVFPQYWVPVIDFSIKPQSGDYSELNKSVPHPDNSKEPHVTGIEVSIIAFRSRQIENVIYPSFIEINFGIWGHEERAGFMSFFRNYRRFIELILENLELDLFTSCCFNNLEKYKGSNIIKKLDLYFSNRQDDENHFQLMRTFNKNANYEIMNKVFKNLMIIYHCCFGYCKKNKEKDYPLYFIPHLFN